MHVPDIAFAGLGLMGAPMCAALVKARYKVTATDNRAECERVAVACGAGWQDTPAQAASGAGVLITMLPGAREVRAAMLGEEGALKSLAAGAAWIDMTSNSPDAARPVQERAMEQGVEVLEAPVGGGIAAAGDGSLQLFVTFICRDVGSVFRGDYLTSFGLDRICEELEAVTALADEYQVPRELSDVVRRTYRRALAEDEAGHKLRTAE